MVHHHVPVNLYRDHTLQILQYKKELFQITYMYVISAVKNFSECNFFYITFFILLSGTS